MSRRLGMRSGPSFMVGGAGAVTGSPGRPAWSKGGMAGPGSDEDKRRVRAGAAAASQSADEAAASLDTSRGARRRAPHHCPP
jgi:hypothetical protein